MKNDRNFTFSIDLTYDMDDLTANSLPRASQIISIVVRYLSIGFHSLNSSVAGVFANNIILMHHNNGR